MGTAHLYRRLRRGTTLAGAGLFVLALLITAILTDSQAPPTPTYASAATAPALPRDFAFSLPLFAAGSAWNQDASTAAVLPASDQQILVTYRVLRGDTTSLHPPDEPPLSTWPFMDVGYDEYTVPVFRASSGQQDVLICDYGGTMDWPSPKFGIDQIGGPVPVPAPAGTIRPNGPQNTDADGHLVLYHPDTFMAYDFWQATTVRDGKCQSRGGGLTGTTILEAGAIDFFDVRESGANVDTYSSAHAVGTPLLAGLILPEDVANGAIAHALAFAIAGPRNTSPDPSEPLPSDYFYPASTTETNYYDTNPLALAAGQRIRLRQSLVDEKGNPINESQLAPITRLFLAALRTYGAYLVDGADGFTFYAEDIHTADLQMTDDEVNTLVGRPAGTTLPAGKTKWQIVMEKLNIDLELIPLAYGPWTNGQDPATAQITTANFEVVETATRPAGSTPTPTGTVPAASPTPSHIYLPMILKGNTPATATPTATVQAGVVPTPPTGSRYQASFPGGLTSWGEEDDITPSDVQSYEQTVGKRIAWVYFSHNWFRDRSFPITTTTWIRATGSVPFIRLMLRSDAVENHAEPTYTLDRITGGDFDADLRAWARTARDFGSPLLAEYGTEVNGEWFPWNGTWNGGGVMDQYGDPAAPDGPERFRDAYRHIIQIARQERATNILWVFHVNGEDVPDSDWNRMENYYPGDDWIDWIGASVYGALTPVESGCTSFRAGMDGIYPRLAALSANKPIVVLEFGVTANNPHCAQDQWARDALTDLTTQRWPRVVGFSWWNEHWENDDIPSHNTTMRVQDNPALAAAFQELVGQNANILGRIATPVE